MVKHILCGTGCRAFSSVVSLPPPLEAFKPRPPLSALLNISVSSWRLLAEREQGCKAFRDFCGKTTNQNACASTDQKTLPYRTI